MNKYRFKTQEEFIRDGQWEDEYDCPKGWSLSGEMNHYLGQDVPEGANESCNLGEGFNDDGWYFESTNYVLKEEDYTGKYIKALVDNPNATGIELGEVIKIIGKPAGYRLDKTSKGYSGMGIRCPLDTSKWELVEEPKDDTKLSSFPSSGAILIDECDNLKEFKRYLFESGKTCNEAVGNPKYLAWNDTSFWYPSTTGKTMYKWNQLKHFIPQVEDIQMEDVHMLDAQQECKRRFPIGCVYKENSKDTARATLRSDESTYTIHGNRIYAHNGGGLLYKNGIYSIAIPEENCDNQDPLYICKQKYRKGMKVKSACKTGVYAYNEFIIDVDPKEFRNLAEDKEIVDYPFSNGYLYYKGEYAEILEEGIYDISEIIKTNKSSVDDYLVNSGFAKSNPEAYNWLMKQSIETVHSVDVNLRTKKQINKFKF